MNNGCVGNRTSSTGKVYLIGAGPGDVELLTLKAVRALSAADVVLMDELVNPAVLEFATNAEKVINVGKRGGVKSTPQELIHQQMVELALSGKTVARVKGGDPFVFGRGGEELKVLRDKGVEVEVISGITSGIAVPAALGIPLSHREYAQTIIFTTGHSKPDGKEPDWESLVATGGTLVIFMGITNIESIVEQLLSAGLLPDTPAAAVANGTLPEQRSVITTIAELPVAVSRLAIKSPAIVIVGQVVALARQIELAVPAPTESTLSRHFVGGGTAAPLDLTLNLKEEVV
jgi:uroporphyrin-III C-methyltransferase